MNRLFENATAVIAAVILVRVTAVLSVGWLLHVVLRNRNPWWRIVLWRTVGPAAIAVIATGPFLTVWGPRVESVSANREWQPRAPSRRDRSPSNAFPSMRSPAVPVYRPENATDDPMEEPSSAVPMPAFEDNPQRLTNRSPTLSIAFLFTFEVIAFFYCLVVAMLMLRLGLQVVGLRTRIHRAEPADDRITTLAIQTARQLGISRLPVVRVSSVTSGPLAAGILKPVIVLPAGLTEQLPEQQLGFVLAHECSHFAGHDLAWELIARIVRILLWPHPLGWGIPAAHRFACDVRCDAVAAGRDATGYSKMLAGMAISLHTRRESPMALAFLEPSETVQRIRLIDAGVTADRPSHLYRMTIAIAMLIPLTLIGTFGIRAIQRGLAQEQAFQDDEQAGPTGETAQVQITIFDPDEKPVEGATILVEYIDYGSVMQGGELGKNQFTTNAQGIAQLTYPVVIPRRSIRSPDAETKISLNIRHPDFVSSIHVGYVDSPIEFTLQPGRRVRLSAKDSVTGQRITEGVYFLQRALNYQDQPKWNLQDDGAFRSHPLDDGINQLLVICLREGQPPLFSDLIDLSGYPKGECRIDDVLLSPGLRVTGQLSDNVPRPVKNGLVRLSVDYAANDQELNKTVSWDDATKVLPDGTFEFISVPRNGWVQLMGVCEGWVSSSTSQEIPNAERRSSIQNWGSGHRFGSHGYYVMAQQFAPTIAGPFDMTMEHAATCETTITDDHGNPLPGATVTISTGAYFFPNRISGLCMPGRTADDLKPFDGKTPQLIQVNRWEDQFPENWSRALTDARGIATIQNLPGKTVHFNVTHDKFKRSESSNLSIDLNPGETSRTTLSPQSKNHDDESEDSKVIELIKQLGGKVEQDYQLPSQPIVGLDLHDSQITDADLEQLSELKHLRSLNLSDGSLRYGRPSITDVGMSHLSELTNLRQLELGSTEITDEGLEFLKKMKDLQTLDLSNNKDITDAGMAHLNELTNLETLRIDYTSVTDGGMKQLKNLTNLHEFSFGGTAVGNDGLQYLAEMKLLVTLVTYQTNVTGAGLVHLTGLKKLELLCLDRDVHDDDLAQLKEMTGLQRLQLIDTQITDAGLDAIRTLTGLTLLDLSGTQITDAGLERLKGMPNLVDLDLNRTQITNEGMKHLNGLINLQGLRLNRTQISDAGLVHLKPLLKLERLELMDTQVTDAGLEHLKGLTSLRHLDVTSTDVTVKGRSMLRRVIPKIEVITKNR